MKQIPFDSVYIPPAPIMQLHVAAPDESIQLGPFSALIDTGSDGTFVATTLLEELDAPIVYMTNVRPHVGANRHRVAVYKVDLHLSPSFRMAGVEVVGDDWGDGVIVGRNVLNRLKILLDGPKQMTDIAE